MISLTLELIDALRWVIGGILLGNSSFNGDELAELWDALCDGDTEGVERVQKDIAYQRDQAEIDDRHNSHDYDCCGYYPYRDD